MAMFKIVLLLYITVVPIATQNYYDRKYDYYDVDFLIHNTRLLKRYLECFLDRGPCPPVGKVFKAVLVEAVQTACAKCSPSQRRLARKTFDAWRKHFPGDLEALRKKLDPQDNYFAEFEKTIMAA